MVHVRWIQFVPMLSFPDSNWHLEDHSFTHFVIDTHCWKVYVRSLPNFPKTAQGRKHCEASYELMSSNVIMQMICCVVITLSFLFYHPTAPSQVDRWNREKSCGKFIYKHVRTLTHFFFFLLIWLKLLKLYRRDGKLQSVHGKLSYNWLQSKARKDSYVHYSFFIIIMKQNMASFKTLITK